MTRRTKRRLIAYTLRTIVFVVLLTCITLMICGVLYIHEHFFADEVKVKVASFWDQGDVSVVEAMESEKKTVILDAGHGGKDQGTNSGNYLEKDINLTVALEMKELLEEKGYQVIMTRSTDDFVELADRSQISNMSDVDLFVSIHCNYCKESSSITGLECYYYTEGSAGRDYAYDIIDYLDRYTNIQNRGTKAEDFYVLRNTNAPAILVELGYMSNSGECQKLVDPSYQYQLSSQLVEAICSCFE